MLSCVSLTKEPQGKWEDPVEGLPCRYNASSAVCGGCLYVFGGVSEASGWLNDLWKFDGSSWARVPFTGMKRPSPRSLCSMVACGGRLYVFGGFGPASGTSQFGQRVVVPTAPPGSEDAPPEMQLEYQRYDEVWCIDPSDGTAQKLPCTGDSAPSKRAAAAVCALTASDGDDGSVDVLYVLGGKDCDGRQGDLYRLALGGAQANVWRGVSPSLTSAIVDGRAFHSLSALQDGKRAVLIGGVNEANAHLADVLLFDSATRTWTKPKKTKGCDLPPLAEHTATVVNDRIFVFGGHQHADASTGQPTALSDVFYVVVVE